MRILRSQPFPRYVTLLGELKRGSAKSLRKFKTFCAKDCKFFRFNCFVRRLWTNCGPPPMGTPRRCWTGCIPLQGQSLYFIWIHVVYFSTFVTILRRWKFISERCLRFQKIALQNALAVGFIVSILANLGRLISGR